LIEAGDVLLVLGRCIAPFLLPKPNALLGILFFSSVLAPKVYPAAHRGETVLPLPFWLISQARPIKVDDNIVFRIAGQFSTARLPKVAQSGHGRPARQCLLSGVKRILQRNVLMSVSPSKANITLLR
jgi:hypothetical protein